jgi:hypothetical protein
VRLITMKCCKASSHPPCPAYFVFFLVNLHCIPPRQAIPSTRHRSFSETYHKVFDTQLLLERNTRDQPTNSMCLQSLPRAMSEPGNVPSTDNNDVFGQFRHAGTSRPDEKRTRELMDESKVRELESRAPARESSRDTQNIPIQYLISCY